jgi:hypothetical protein
MPGVVLINAAGHAFTAHILNALAMERSYRLVKIQGKAH